MPAIGASFFYPDRQDQVEMRAPVRNPKIDEYIAKSQPFARPILTHLRDLLHQACPEVEETMKWSQPFFVYQGCILCNMAGFKAHCSFHFWGKEISAALGQAKATDGENLASFGRIATLAALPADERMLSWMRQAAAFIDSGQYTSPMAARPKKPREELAELPPSFAAALQKNKKASKMFEAFSPSCKREYIEWVTEAKRPETRDKRIATAVEWIAEGKQRNWKYQSC